MTCTTESFNENSMANIWFRYSGTPFSKAPCGHFYDERDCIRGGNSVIDNIRHVQSELDHRAIHCYNDMQFYEDLLRQEGCAKVDISTIFVRHATPLVRIGVGEAAKHICVGIRVDYRQTFQDGSFKIVSGPNNVSPAEPSFSFYSSREHKFQLRRNEFLNGIRLHKSITVGGAEYLSGITFVTNHREHNFGAVSRREHIYTTPLDVTPSDMRIVALCGTHSGLICQHLGIYAKAFGWKTRGPHILLRKLLVDGRAEPVAINDPTPLNDSIRWLMDVDPGLFRTILNYV